MKFVKVDGYWYEFDESTPINDARVWNYYGGCMSGLDLSNAQIVEAEDFHFLDWSNTELCSDEFVTGWLNPQGEFYGCSPKNHKEQAKLVHGLEEKDLEEKLYIKLTYLDRLQTNLVAMVPHFKGQFNEISNHQYKFLKKHPISNFDEIDYIYRMQLQKRITENKNNPDSPENGSGQPGM